MQGNQKLGIYHFVRFPPDHRLCRVFLQWSICRSPKALFN